jgi:hypothetical protein
VAEVANLTDAIATGLLRSSPALAGRLTTAEAELGRLREAAVPKEVKDLDRLIPRVADDFRSMVAELPTALQRDVARSRAAICRLLAGSIHVVANEQEIRCIAENGRTQAAFSRSVGAGLDGPNRRGSGGVICPFPRLQRQARMK